MKHSGAEVVSVIAPKTGSLWSRRLPIWHLVTLVYFVGRAGKKVRIEEGIYLIRGHRYLTAYKNALKVGRSSENTMRRFFGKDKTTFSFIGVNEIIPVWETFEHGSELGFREFKVGSIRDAKRDVLTMKDVALFQSQQKVARRSKKH